MPDFIKETDFIIIGAGSAGSVLAWELSARLNAEVLVLESGERASHRNSRIPAQYPHLFRDRRYCADFMTVPQNGLSGRKVFLPAGRGLGGSSLINAMIWVPPHIEDLQRWSKTTDHAWSTTEMQAAVQQLHEIYFPEGFDVRETYYTSSSTKSLIDASERSGPFTIAPFPRSLRDGKRLTAWQAFRHSHLGRHNHAIRQPEVMRGGEVQSLLVADGSVRGVNVLRTSHNSTASESETTPIRARQAVIVCAGAIQTPALLLRSGIGPEEELRSVGIRPVCHSPQVGKNFQDHLLVPVTYSWNGPTLASRFDRLQRIAWLHGETNELCSNIAEAGTFLSEKSSPSWSKPAGLESTSVADSNSELPVLQWHLTPTHYLEYPFRQSSTPAITIGVTPLHPKSRGEITLGPDHQPVIDPQYLTDPSDRLELIQSIHQVRDVVEHWRESIQVGEELLPGLRRQSDAQLDSAISRYATTLYHYAGSCAAGGQPTNVCDKNFQVRGLNRLFLCDASVLPDLPSGNTQVAVMMLGKLLANRLAEAVW